MDPQENQLQNPQQNSKASPDTQSKQKIMTKSEMIQHMIKNKGFTKVKIIPNFRKMFSLKNDENFKSTILLMPLSYTVNQTITHIKQTFKISEKDAIYIYIDSKGILNQGQSIRELKEKYTDNSLMTCLQIKVYSSQFM